jgi:hypothetical protein
MDRKTDERKEVAEVKPDANALLKLLLQIADDDQKKVNIAIDNKLKSRWLWGKHRVSLIMDKAFNDAIVTLTKQGIYDFFDLENIKERLENLEKVVQTIAEKVDVDLTNVKSEIEKLTFTLDSQAIARIDKFIQELKEVANKRREAMEGYVK